jgi:hypothetical protein
MARVWMVLLCAGWFAFPAFAGEIEDNVAKLNIPPEQLLKMGDEIYNTEGANTCHKCHGPGGTGGDQAGAADLRHPRTWRVYQALGGDDAFKANKEKFLKEVESVIHDLIRNGATAWNLRFVKAHPEIKLDWAKVSVPDKADKYNTMMKGLTSDPMVKKVKEIGEQLAKEGKKLDANQLRDLCAVADFTYVKTLDDGSDKGGVFK